MVTTGQALRSGIGDYTRHMLPHLAKECELSVFVPPGQLEGESSGRPLRPLGELRPREHDHILYQLGNERAHAFMLPLIRTWGGTVVLHDWILFDLALAAFPALARGGVRGHLLALREGGLRQGLIYARNRWTRRRFRRTGLPGASPDQVASGASSFGQGWYGPEAEGRWSEPAAALVLPPEAHRLHFCATDSAGRSLRICNPRGQVVELGHDELVEGKEVTIELGVGGSGVVLLETSGARPTAEQVQLGDTRVLGTFFTHLSYTNDGGRQVLDLDSPAPAHGADHPLTADRFSLPLNRSIVRHADSFIVHSEHVARLVREERNAMTAVRRVPHGAQGVAVPEGGQSRAELRRELGLDDDWLSVSLFVSFGALQRHKRIDKLLAALGQARERGVDLRLVLAGALRVEEMDVESAVAQAGLTDAVIVTGYLAEEEIDPWIDAADVCVNLRGPSTGGTSGGLHRCLGRGRMVLASDLDEQGELPDSCVLKVAPGPGEVRALARVMEELALDPGRRRQYEAAACRYVEESCQWSRVARQYVTGLATFPHPRARRASLIKSAVAAADGG